MNAPRKKAQTTPIQGERGKPVDHRAAFRAQMCLRPTVQAASVVNAYNKTRDWDGPAIGDLLAELVTQVETVTRGDLTRAESMLLSQAHSLEAIFASLARRAALNAGEYLGTCETYLRLALKAQSQCRATLETLALIKNPPPVAFVRQANIAHGPQQVINAAAPTGEGSCAREIGSEQSKLLEVEHGERLDTGTAGTASSADLQLATVGAINRAKDSTG